jgi:hypothetical protein
MNIAFVPGSTANQQQVGEVFLIHKLQQLGLCIVGNVQTWSRQLWPILEHFYSSNAMGRTIKASKCPGAFITIQQAIPCILHLEN